jgi:hypothetical protein
VTQEDLIQLLARKQLLEDRAAADPELNTRLQELRRWQANRLSQTYSDLPRGSRFIPALDFFLTDLYGPNDFARRDADLKRALTRLKRALPGTLLEVLRAAIELLVLTLELDEQMASALATGGIDANSYASAYRNVGRADDRRRQIDLIVRMGEDLGKIVGQNWIRIALRAAHVPARMGGFGALQGFLERGFRAFDRMGDPAELLTIINERETRLMNALLGGDSSLLPRSDARSIPK